jgi:hypothetical protein
MDLKLQNKNNIGVAATLILIILLSQTRIFNFLFTTPFGRAVLIFLILILSYINKILGIFIVFFIIILFSQSSIGYLEGFNLNNNNQQKEVLKVNKKKEAREGFNMSDREITILRGKSSQQIPVNENSRVQLENNIEPTDKSIFLNNSSEFLTL